MASSAPSTPVRATRTQLIEIGVPPFDPSYGTGDHPQVGTERPRVIEALFDRVVIVHSEFGSGSHVTKAGSIIYLEVLSDVVAPEHIEFVRSDDGRSWSARRLSQPRSLLYRRDGSRRWERLDDDIQLAKGGYEFVLGSDPARHPHVSCYAGVRMSRKSLVWK